MGVHPNPLALRGNPFLNPSRAGPETCFRRFRIDPVRAQAWILHTQFASELAAEARADVVCCDRAVLDNFCYLKRAATGDPHVEVLERLVRAWTPTYDVLFRVPVLADPRFDGVRDTDLAFQHDIDALIAATLSEWSVPHLALEPATRPRWAEIVVETLLPRLRPQELLFPDDNRV